MFSRIGVFVFALMFLQQILYASPVLANTSWSEDFKDGNYNDWDTMAYNSSNIWTGKLTRSDAQFSVIDEALTSPDFDSFQDSAHAYHDSTAAYGSWSFDWSISNDKQSYDAVEFIFSDERTNYNWSGLHENEKNLTGYGLVLGSYDEPKVLSKTPGLTLAKFKNTDNRSIASILLDHRFDGSMEGTHHIRINRNRDGEFKVYFDGELTIRVTDNEYKSSEKFGFTSWIGASSISNIMVKALDVQSPSTIHPAIIFIILLSVGGTGYYLVNMIRIKLKIKDVIPSRFLIRHITEIIDYRPNLFYLIFGDTLSNHRKIETELKDRVPPEIFNYKFLMNPIRLVITKLLYEKVELSSIEIRDMLQIPWGNYSTHVRALKKHDIIQIKEEFVDSSVKQILTLSPKGIEEYKALIDILKQFLDQATSEDLFLMKESDTYRWITDRYLYPNDRH